MTVGNCGCTATFSIKKLFVQITDEMVGSAQFFSGILFISRLYGYYRLGDRLSTGIDQLQVEPLTQRTTIHKSIPWTVPISGTTTWVN
jgi:hypothetical protein